MRNRSFISALLGAASLAACLGASPAFAANFASYISGKGNDAGNNCALPGTPCRTFAHALTQTNANGEIKTLDPASYGIVTINKSVTITGVPGAGIVMNGAGTAITINAGVNGIVSLRGIEINGQGLGTSGISVVTGKVVNIVDCVVRRVNGDGISISPSSGTTSATISNTISSNNGNFGIQFVPGSDSPVRASIDHSTMNDNGFSGVLVAANATVMIADSFANNNVSDGYRAVGATVIAPTIMRLTRSVATTNSIGINNLNSAAIVQTFQDNKVIGNTTDVSGALTPVANK